jgi:hypothetical protein
MNKYRFAFSYIFCVALVSVIREKLMVNISPIIILFISSSLACIYFHLINYRENYNLYKKLLNERPLFIQINLIVALMWITTYYSIYLSSASIFVYEFFMVGGYLSQALQKNKTLSQKLILLILISLICMPFLIYSDQIYGIFLGIAAGMLGFIYNINSHKLATSLSLSASQVLASRFWLLILFSAANLPREFVHQITLNAFVMVIVITALSFILQVWLNQKSVITVGGRKSSFFSILAPALTFVIQGVILNHWELPILVLSLLGAGTILYRTTKNTIMNKGRENIPDNYNHLYKN